VNRKKSSPAPSPSRNRDLDETRRLAYMALIAASTKKHVLGGTLVNALVHHQKAATAEEALQHVSVVLEGEGDGTSEAWLRSHIDRITTELGD
jgi:hypothetical protein